MSTEPGTRLQLPEALLQEMREIPQEHLNELAEQLPDLHIGPDEPIDMMDEGLIRLHALHALYEFRARVAVGSDQIRFRSYAFLLHKMFIVAIMEQFDLWDDPAFMVGNSWTIWRPANRTLSGSAPVTNDGRDGVRGEKYKYN